MSLELFEELKLKHLQPFLSQLWTIPRLPLSLSLLAEVLPLFQAFLQAKEGFLLAWPRDLHFIRLVTVCVFNGYWSVADVSISLLLLNSFLSKDDASAVSIVLSIAIFLFGTIFTELLNYKYFLSLTLEHLVLFLSEELLHILCSSLLGSESLFFSEMLFTFLFSHLLEGYSFDLNLNKKARTLILLRVSSIFCLYFLSSRRW